MTGYEDGTEHLIDELRRLDLLLRLHLAEWRADGAPDDTGGLYISDAEVDYLLIEHDERRTPGTGDVREKITTLDDAIDRRTTAAREAGTELRLVELAERFALTPRQKDALLLSYAPEFDRKYETIFAYLQDDITQRRPTVGLMLRVLCPDDRERLGARQLFTDSSPLVRHRLIRRSPPDENAPLLANRVTADWRIVAYLLGDDDVDPTLEDATTLVTPTTGFDDLPVDDRTREQLERAAPGADSPPVMRYVYGPYGVGTDGAAEAMCHTLETRLVRVDLETIGSDVVSSLSLAMREARLRDAALHLAGVHHLGETDGTSVDSVARYLDRFEGHVFLTGESEWTLGRPLDGHGFLSVHVPRPGFTLRKALWEQRVDSLPPDVDARSLASAFRLTSGQIDDAIAMAEELSGGDDVTADALYRGCRTQTRETLGSLARQTDPSYIWEDIVLPDDQTRHLREVAAHIKHRGTVYADWGFEDRFSLGNGITVLFTGPSGTGKTMAAEIIANDAGLDMFKIDLASVVSKYVGETEENLKRIFDESEHSDAILFFDEADALFGERSEISDSHDRYANIEVSYLLQRVEEHDGAVILASNFKENIDDAFHRRINVHVSFPRPDRASRNAIWRAIFPDETPVGEIDVEFLSGFELTGGNIKNVALTASFLAADDETADRVEMNHVGRALRRELQKTGRLVDPEDFETFRE